MCCLTLSVDRSGLGSEYVPLDGALTVDIIVKLHEGAVRFGDERLKELRGSNTRPRSLRSKYEAESIEQPNLESMCQAGAAMGGVREPALTCQTNGKFLRFARMRTIQRSFQIDEETKVSESTSFPGRVSRESGIAVWFDTASTKYYLPILSDEEFQVDR